jgi:hypothetical protein
VIFHSGAFSENKESSKTAKRTAKSVVLIALYLMGKNSYGRRHRDGTRASTLCCFCLFFSSFDHAKNLLIMGPNNTKNSSKSVIFSYSTMTNIVRILLLL